MSLADILGVEEMRVYQYGEDVVLTVVRGVTERLCHLYENDIEGRVIYGMNRGRLGRLDRPPLFVGRPSSVEIAFYKGDRDWDFHSLTIRGDKDEVIRIARNNAS